jgi:hypothetical protein
VVAAVRTGGITIKDAFCLYQLSEEVLLSWARAIDTYGLAGLRTTRIQQYRLTSVQRHPAITAEPAITASHFPLISFTVRGPLVSDHGIFEAFPMIEPPADGEHNREMARGLRHLARLCRFAGARKELLHLAANYGRGADHFDSRA